MTNTTTTMMIMMMMMTMIVIIIINQNQPTELSLCQTRVQQYIQYIPDYYCESF